MAIRLKNLRRFNQQLAEFSKEFVPEEHLRFQRRIALELLRRIVFKTPVDTGRARGNWQLRREGTENELDRFDQGGGATVSAGVAAASRLTKPFDTISIFNNVNYITFLEQGSSQQARTGMVDVSLVEVEAIFQRG